MYQYSLFLSVYNGDGKLLHDHVFMRFTCYPYEFQENLASVYRDIQAKFNPTVTYELKSVRKIEIYDWTTL